MEAKRIGKSDVARFMLLLALLSVGCGSDATGPDGAGDPAVSEFTAQMNAHRADEGCGPLIWHEGVAQVADAHSRDMVDRGFFSHTNPDGENPFDRLAEAEISWSGGAGENIAAGTSDPATVLSMWLNSAGHRANIENCGYTHHGVGLASGYWTHVFVTDPD